jgi:hypothetical protein
VVRSIGLKVAILVCGAAAVALRGTLGEANAMRRMPGARWLPDQRLARLFSLGQRSTCADVMWLNSIGDLSHDFGDVERKRKWIDTVLASITRLEPTFSSVYSWGATYLGMIERDKERAIELLEKGAAANPDDLKLAVELAMAYFEYKQDRAATVKVLEKVVKDPRCDAITMGFYNSLLVDDRADFAALAQWAPWLDSPNDEVREGAEFFQELVKKRIAFRAFNDYEAEHHRKARSPEELRDPKLMAPEVFELVLPAVQIDLTGHLHFAHLDELERRRMLRSANAWTKQFHAETGRLPTLDELMANGWVRRVALLPATHLVIDEHGVRVEVD